MPSTFEKDTRVTPSGADPAMYEMILDPSWWVGQGPSGGYVAAGMLRALQDRFEHAAPLRDLSVSFLEPAKAGPARIETQLIRKGGSVTIARATMRQDRTPLATMRATTGAAREGPSFVAQAAPDVAGWETARPFDPPKALKPPTFVQHCEFRIAGGAAPLGGDVGDEMCAWMRMAEPTPMDEPLLAFLADAWMPALFAVVDEPVLAPSLDMSLQVQALPEAHGDDEPLLGVFSAETARDGYAFEDGTLWTREGELVARARQTRRVLHV